LQTAEVARQYGDSLLWEARLAVSKQDEALVQALLAQLKPVIGEAPAKIE